MSKISNSDDKYKYISIIFIKFHKCAISVNNFLKKNITYISGNKTEM